MNTVFKSENYRLSRSKEVWTMLISLFLLQVGTVIAGFAIRHMGLFKEITSSMGDAMNYKPGFLENFANMGNSVSFRLFLVIMVCSLVTKLYQTGVNKQLVSSGIRREKVILGEFFSFTAVFTVAAVILASTNGILSMIQGGGFGYEGMEITRVLLSFVGMILTVASSVAMFLLVSHIAGSMGGAITLGMIAELGVPSAIYGIVMYTKWEAISTYYIGTAQSAAVSTTGAVKDQLIGIATLVVYTVVFVVLTQVAFNHKEVK